MTADMMEWPYHGYVEGARVIRVPGYGFDHEVRVWLPPSYRHTDRSYPTLWVTDNALEAAHTAVLGCLSGDAPEVIIVAIGSPRELAAAESQRRRTYDFMPPTDELSTPALRDMPAAAVGGAPLFRDFLIDELRPVLA